MNPFKLQARRDWFNLLLGYFAGQAVVIVAFKLGVLVRHTVGG
jgi:hypothetical protein